MGIISEMLSYPFMVRALIGGLLVSLCASLLGVSLVLKRYSMIGDGLSHVSFGSLSIALAAGWSPLKVSIPVVVLAAFFLLRITEHGKVKSDAAIAMISASALALPTANRHRQIINVILVLMLLWILVVIVIARLSDGPVSDSHARSPRSARRSGCPSLRCRTRRYGSRCS